MRRPLDPVVDEIRGYDMRTKAVQRLLTTGRRADELRERLGSIHDATRIALAVRTLGASGDSGDVVRSLYRLHRVLTPLLQGAIEGAHTGVVQCDCSEPTPDNLRYGQCQMCGGDLTVDHLPTPKEAP